VWQASTSNSALSPLRHRTSSSRHRARPTPGTGRGVEGSALTRQRVVAAVGCLNSRLRLAAAIAAAPGQSRRFGGFLDSLALVGRLDGAHPLEPGGELIDRPRRLRSLRLFGFFAMPASIDRELCRFNRATGRARRPPHSLHAIPTSAREAVIGNQESLASM
jgi:hypothetical protein